MKKISSALSAFALCCFLAGFSVIGADDGAAPAGETVIVSSQYVALAKLLANAKGDNEKASEIAAKSLRSVVEKGQTYEEKLQLLAEISTSLLAAIVDWDEASRIAIVRAIINETLRLAPEGDAHRIGYVKQAMSAMSFASGDTVPLMAAIDELPDDLKDVGKDAVQTPLTALGGTAAWACRDLYKDVYEEIKGEPIPNEDYSIVTVSTTTTTTTSTTTTTTTIAGSGNEEIITPPTVPTTRPSPTPVGLR